MRHTGNTGKPLTQMTPEYICCCWSCLVNKGKPPEPVATLGRYSWRLEDPALRQDTTQPAKVWKELLIGDSCLCCAEGYRLQMLTKLHHNGVAFGFCLLPGPHDEIIEWPFKHRCEVELWNVKDYIWCQRGRPIVPDQLLGAHWAGKDTHHVRFNRPASDGPNVPWFWKDISWDGLEPFIEDGVLMWRIVIKHLG